MLDRPAVARTARNRPPQDTFMEHSDILVVGAGSAGAAMAARLSEEPTLRVTLVEAGSDTVPGEVPDDIKDIFPRSFLNSDYFWPNLTASLTDGDAAHPFPQARVVGGGSSVMGMIALRGLPSDYDGWEARGARNWGWRDVLPYFRAMTCRILRNAAQPGQGTGEQRTLLSHAGSPPPAKPQDHDQHERPQPANRERPHVRRRRQAGRRDRDPVCLGGRGVRGRRAFGGAAAALRNRAGRGAEGSWNRVGLG